MSQPPPISTRSDTPFPYPTLFRSQVVALDPEQQVREGDRVLARQPARRRQAGKLRQRLLRCHRRPVGAGDRPEEAVGEHSVLVLGRSEEHTSELQSLMRISYAVFCLKKKKHI